MVPTLAELVGALGRPHSAAVIDGFCAGGEASLLAFLDWLAEPTPSPGLDVNGRAAHEDEEWVLTRLATAHPEAFVARLAREPSVAIDFLVLSALARVAHPAARDYLVDALGARSGSERWLALKTLLRWADPSVTSRLDQFLRDRDHLVRFEAAKGLRRFGGPEDVAPLLAFAERATIGAREAAIDAVEGICDRHGLSLPEGHPGPRLVAVDLPERPDPNVRIAVSTALQVAPGDVLAELGDGEVVRATCKGVVVAIDELGGRPAQIIIRSGWP